MDATRLITNALSPAECSALISLAETIGFESAKIDGALDGPRGFRVEDGRDNDRAAIEDQTVAELIWARVSARIPTREGWAACGINERLRFYRYAPGQSFPFHQDGFYQRSDDERSFVTLLVYLNEDFAGGATVFRDPDEQFTPEAGSILLFPHERWHEGRPIERGTKYVLRTDVMFRRSVIS